MYFTKLCRFTKVIRSFSFTVEISLEAQKAPAFMALNFFSTFLHLYYARAAIQSDPDYDFQGVCKTGQSITCNTVCVSVQTETHTKHVYTFICVRVQRSPFLLHGSRTVVASLQACQMVVIQFEISRATSDTDCTLTWQLWQRSVSYICQPLSQGLKQLFCFTDVGRCCTEIQTYKMK